jgi:hypothetical protein
MCWDGLKQHHSLMWIRSARLKRVRTLLRYSHGSQDNQHEDFENYAYFKPAFAAEKMKLRTDKVTAAKEEAKSDGDVMRCAKRPWEEAFDKQRTLRGWQKEGIFPKFNCAFYWRLKAEESKAQVTDKTRPRVEPDEEWLRKFNAPHSSAALIDCNPKQLDEEGLQAEVELRVQARLDGAPAPEKLPAVRPQ